MSGRTAAASASRHGTILSLEQRLLLMPPVQLLPTPGIRSGEAGCISQLIRSLFARLRQRSLGARGGQLNERYEGVPQWEVDAQAGVWRPTGSVDRNWIEIAKKRSFDEYQRYNIPNASVTAEGPRLSDPGHRSTLAYESAATRAHLLGVGHSGGEAMNRVPPARQVSIQGHYTPPQQAGSAEEAQGSWTLAGTNSPYNPVDVLLRDGIHGRQLPPGAGYHPTQSGGLSPTSTALDPGQPGQRQQRNGHQQCREDQQAKDRPRKEETPTEKAEVTPAVTAAPEEGAPPVKRRRGRPRIYPPGQSPSALKRKMYKGTGRPRGRPRKHPKPEEPAPEKKA